MTAKARGKKKKCFLVLRENESRCKLYEAVMLSTSSAVCKQQNNIRASEMAFIRISVCKVHEKHRITNGYELIVENFGEGEKKFRTEALELLDNQLLNRLWNPFGNLGFEKVKKLQNKYCGMSSGSRS